MDLLGPFPKAKGGKEYLVVAVDYFTRWIEVKALSSITSKKIQDFCWEDIICQCSIYKILITKSSLMQRRDFCEGLGIEQQFTSVAYSQTNGFAEVTNRIILRGLKKRLKGAKGN